MMVGYIFQRIAIDSEVLGFTRPEQRLKWSLDYSNRYTGLACNLNGSVTGLMELKEVYGTAYNVDGSPKIERCPAFAVVNAEIGKDFGGGFQVSVGAKNLFDFNQADVDGPLMFNEQRALEDVVYIRGPLLGRLFYARLTSEFGVR